MPTNYDVTDYLYFYSTTGGTGTLSWSSANNYTTVSGNDFITDQNDDGDWDIGTDTWGSYGDAFSGYTWTAPNGTVYPIFVYGGNNYYLPYDSTQYDVGAVFPTAGSTTDYTDNAIAHPLCFAAGSRIATPTGEVAVEALQIGDMVSTADGRTVPVKWLGRQTVSTRFGPAERLQPVRVKAGALGDGLPLRDLVLTADHALLIDGLLVNASALVNGTTITWVPLSEFGDSYTVYHVETEDHDIILAEGTPAETLIDYVGRRAFDNYAEFVALYGEDRTICEMAYPRVSAARLLPPSIRSRLAARAVA